jgi:hypothetical protein
MDNLTPEEVRLVENHRAIKAVEYDSIDSDGVSRALRQTILRLLMLGMKLNPRSEAWFEVKKAAEKEWGTVSPC